MMCSQQDSEHIHASGQGYNRAVGNSQKQKAWPAHAAQPMQHRYRQQSLDVVLHSSLEAIF
jgi:hypothetical protein